MRHSNLGSKQHLAEIKRSLDRVGKFLNPQGEPMHILDEKKPVRNKND
jgi:hypothetical protein